MDRKCSWWNSKKSLQLDYVLQHEQIHFALTEVAARQLNQQARKIVDATRVTGESAQEVKELIGQRVKDVLDEAQQKLLERNREFDEDTSGKHNEKGQQRWAEQVFAELEALER